MGYMDKQPSRMQGQFCFSRSGGVGKEHGLHLGGERGVHEAGLNIGRMLSSRGHPTNNGAQRHGHLHDPTPFTCKTITLHLGH